MKNFLTKILTIFCFIVSHNNFSQIGINSTGTPPEPSAMLDVSSNTKGFLPPRMTLTQRSAINATAGLMVYCTDCTPAGHYAFTGSG
jgi:hypothetical protein